MSKRSNPKQGRIHGIRCVLARTASRFGQKRWFCKVSTRVWPTDQRMDGRTDRRTDTPSYRDARTHLKRIQNKCSIQSTGEDARSNTIIINLANSTKHENWHNQNGIFGWVLIREISQMFLRKILKKVDSLPRDAWISRDSNEGSHPLHCFDGRWWKVLFEIAALTSQRQTLDVARGAGESLPF